MMNLTLSRRALAMGAFATGALCVAINAWTAPTSISNEPLASPVTNTAPNVMFILDDSGSMGSNFSPDYINDSQDGSSGNRDIGGCYDSKNTNNNITDAQPRGCGLGDPPFMAHQYNKQYYNPAITYQPSLNYDGTAKTSYTGTSAATGGVGWTAVPYDAYGIQSTSTINLVTSYPDKVWCTTAGDTASDTTLCKRNGGYNYPSDTYGYGKTLNTNAYYYTIQATEYCDNAGLIGTPTGAVGSRCVPTTDAAYTTSPSTATLGAAVFAYPAPVRFCAGVNPNLAATITDCRDKHLFVNSKYYYYPKFLGTVAAGAGVATASATITISAGTVAAAGITNITTSENGANKRLYSATQSGLTSNTNGVSAVTMTNGVITSGAGTDTAAKQNDIAIVINAAINNYTAVSGYTSTVAGNVVTVKPVTVGATILSNNTDNINGESIIVTAPASGTKGTATFTVNSVGTTNSSNSLRINVGANIIGSAIDCKSLSTTNCATAIKNAIQNTNTASGSFPDFTATSTGNSVTISTAVPSTAANTLAVTISLSSGTPGTAISAATVTGGVTNSINAVTVAFSGGLDGGLQRLNTGTFTRVNIVSGSTYARANSRTDCAADPCTYNEEMTNFANWHAYYRTRLQMMKTAAGLTFGAIDDSFRVGFLTISPMSSGSISSDRYLKISEFTSGVSGHKKLWYDKFYNTDLNASTPLREALSRAGHIYAGKVGSSATTLTNGIPAADDPVLFSCQPNFTILSTDGYWNGNAGTQMDGTTAIGNQDGDAADAYSRGYTTAVTTAASNVIGVYEGSGATSSNSLADVAQYYYKTDLRPSMANNVRPRDYDDAPHQHMTTFTIGLGLDGFLSYNSKYNDSNLTSGDFYDIRRGAKTWPVPAADTPSALDDLWHAAVNGRGQFYSASNPQELVEGLIDALNTLQKATGAGAAAATSNLRPVAGDNFAFAGEYTTVEWSGDIKAYTLDLANGYVSNNSLWSAKQQLDSRAYTQRSIYTFDSGDAGGNLLRHFCIAGSGAGCSDGSGLTVAEQAQFSPALLAQYGTWNAVQKTATAGAMVNYLRGDRTNEENSLGDINDLFRARTTKMGDIVGSKPAYLKGATFSYADAGYSAFKSCTLGTGTGCPGAQFPTPTVPRRSTVFVGANEGMLHAFETDVNNNAYYQTAGISTSSLADDTFNGGNNTGNGVERWAYIPQMLFPNLRSLANSPYDHTFMVDGSPIIGDICTSAPCAGLNDWRTIMVTGLRSGGRGFFALDITDPLAPKGMWEFGIGAGTCYSDAQIAVGDKTSDCNVGLSYGDPIITKRKSDGKWVVIVSSGLNNYNPGNGQGYLYVLEATTGKILSRVNNSTGGGGTAGAGYADASPSGFARISAWSDSPLTDNTTLAVYGGDLLGNMWRFDLDSASAGYLTATKIFTARDTRGTVQPITTKPELALIQSKRVLAFATGQYIGIPDKATTAGQSVYAVNDDLTATTRTRSDLAQRNLVTSVAGTTRSVTTSANTVLWSGSNKGWYADFPASSGAAVSAGAVDPAERVFVDPILQAGSFVVASTSPNTSDGCSAGGDSWLNTFGIETGLIPPGVASGLTAGIKVTGVIVGFSLIQLPSGEVKTEIRLGTGESLTRDTPVTGGAFGGRRVTWRELTGMQQ